MSVRRLSISVPPEVEQSIRAAAAAAGLPVSAWLVRAAAHAAKIEAGRAAVREFEAELGPLSEEDRREARRVLVEAGLLEDVRAAG
jgi:hypothetical protein